MQARVNYIFDMDVEGSSLIEVLVSLFLLSLILLGFDVIELTAIQTQQNAYYFNTALHQLSNMTERLYAMPDTSYLATQIQEWNQENQQVLPQGRGMVTGVYPHLVVMILWGKVKAHCHYQGGAQGCLKQSIDLAD